MQTPSLRSLARCTVEPRFSGTMNKKASCVRCLPHKNTKAAVSTRPWPRLNMQALGNHHLTKHAESGSNGTFLACLTHNPENFSRIAIPFRVYGLSIINLVAARCDSIYPAGEDG